MIPEPQVSTRPEQLVLYSRGTRPSGNGPAAFETIQVPIFSSASHLRQDHMNYQDSSKFNQRLEDFLQHGLRRYVGLWLLDVFIFNDQAGVFSYAERTFDALTQGIPGFTDTFRQLFTRQVDANAPFRQTLRVMNVEARIKYMNLAVASTDFDMSVIARAG